MDKEKQIEEMAKILYEPYYEQESDVLSGGEQAYCERKAEALYNAGYGKLPQWVKINPETMSIDAQIEECRACQAEHDKLEAENDKLKDRISALEIDQSQFEELEKQLAIYKRALRTACLVKGSCRNCWERHDKRCKGMVDGEVKVCIEHFIQQAEKEMEEQDK